MKHPKHSNVEAQIKRQKARDYARHWTKARSLAAHINAFHPPLTPKSIRRIAIAQKSAQRKAAKGR